jgi:hypothetical protein
MQSKNGGEWSRRRILKSIPGLMTSAALPAHALAMTQASMAIPAFSRFVNLSESAGLTQTMFYGESTKATYITEIMGGGCAFFDYDNDGWMDAFILGGRKL